MKSLILLLFFCLTTQQLFSQQINDSIALKSIVIHSFGHNKKWINNSSSSSVLDSCGLSIHHKLSPANALNSISSVRFSERGIDGSRRISIRGSGLRSPFGVRNLKFYWNNIPITSPDGSTGLEILDLNLINTLTVIKGPASSAYGAGMGGVLLAKSTLDKSFISSSTTVGSWNTNKYILSGGLKTNKVALSIALIKSNTDGYRDQEFNKKRQLFSTLSYQLTKNHTIGLLANIYKGKWGLPGAIDSLKVEQDPRQAVSFSESNNTRVERDRLRIGVSHAYKTSRFNLNSLLYYNTSTKINPFGTSSFFNGYKDEFNTGFGGRIESDWDFNILRTNTHIVIGSEFQSDKNNVLQYTLNNGEKGSLSSDNRTSTLASTSFFDWQLKPEKWLISLGASLNFLSYRTKDVTELNRTFSPVVSPRISFLRKINSRLSMVILYASGYNPPTIWDLMQNDSTLNMLSPEIGNNFELGVKYKKNKLKTSLQIFHLNTRNAIVSTQQPNLSFMLTNAGKTEQTGIELEFNIDSLTKKYILSLDGSYSYSHYIFSEYVNNGDDLSSNLFSGIPRHIFFIQSSIAMPLNFYINTNLRFEGDVYLNDANTAQFNSYMILSGKIGWSKTIKKHWNINLAINGINLTNTVYSSFLQLNGFGGRFFNPSPTRSYFGNITITYLF